MIPLLTYPLALIAALAIPTLIAIYFFRNRFKRHSVAGLFLWEHAMRAREGGRVIRRIRTSPLFILELLALLALILAATDPRLPFRGSGRSLVVILDNSASMLAGTKESRPRDLALPAIRKVVRNGQFRSIRFMLAGQNPVLLNISQNGNWTDSELAAEWNCQATSSNIDGAIAMASELTAGQSQLLVVTDHMDSAQSEKGQMEWHAFGSPVENLGFINSRRSLNNGNDRLFIAVGNYSENGIKLTIPVATAGQIIKTLTLEISSGDTGSAIITLPPDCGPITMTLPADGLAIDNSVTLLPEETRPIGVRIAIGDDNLRSNIENAIAATGLRDTLAPTHLVITDGGNTSLAPEEWTLKLIIPPHPAAYAGPFVVDYNHPLAHGLNLDGVVWGASATNSLSGNPIILAGNIPLLSERILASGKHIFNLQFAPQLSNIQTTPAWPALIWNIAKLRSDALPGTQRVNLPIDSIVQLALPRTMRELTVIYPDGTHNILHPKECRISIDTPQSGIYSLSSDKFAVNLAANFMAPAESNLRNCQTGKQGNWHNRETLMLEYRSWAWIAALAALLMLVLHTLLTAKQRADKDQIS